jgi:hypothetical protein
MCGLLAWRKLPWLPTTTPWRRRLRETTPGRPPSVVCAPTPIGPSAAEVDPPDDAIDTKALVVLAAAIAALAALAAFHEGINRLWWIPALGLLGPCVLFALVIHPYDVTPASDLLDLHDQMRDEGRLETARELLDDLTFAADRNDVPLGLKGSAIRIRTRGAGCVSYWMSAYPAVPALI